MPTGQEIIEQATLLLSDEGNVRWELPEMARWINNATKAIILAKPSASSQTVQTGTLAAGTLQSAPNTGTPTPIRIIGVGANIRDVGPPVLRGRVIKVISRNQLDAHFPTWQDIRFNRPTKEVREIIFDENTPYEFLVNPPNDGTGRIELKMSVLPAPITGDGETVESYSADTGLDDIYLNPYVDFVCYRAYAKDDQGGNPARAQFYYQQFAQALGIKVRVESATTPNAKRLEK